MGMWKPIYFKGEKTHLEGSPDGLIRKKTKDGHEIKKFHIDEYGYVKVKFTWNNIKYSRRVHRLIAQTFLENPENKPEVNHKNLNKQDNRVENLQWATKKENAEHAGKNGRLSRGSRKLPPKTVGRYLFGSLVKTYPSISAVKKDGFPRISVTRSIDKQTVYRGFTWNYI
jgi:hypothetical protein